MGQRVDPQQVWVTGGSGFVGGYLRDELLRRGHDVLVIDRRAVVEPTVDIDLADASAVRRLLDEHQPDTILHLAAQSSGRLSLEEPVHTVQNNISITLGLLEAIRSLDPELRPRLLSVGSCEEYGFVADDSELPLHESQPLRPSNPYATSKAAQTLLCQQYRRTWGLETLSVRAFTHTGPGQDERFVFSSWARQVALIERNGGTLKVGNLAARRDVSDVRDVARAYCDLIEVDWPWDVVNVCSGREILLEDALGILRDASTTKVEFETDPELMRPSDVPRFVGDTSRLSQLNGQVPSTPIESTLKDLLEDWRARLA